MEDSRYWTIFRFCPLIDGTCNSRCLNFKKKPVTVVDGKDVLDQAFCFHFNSFCAFKYKKKEVSKEDITL